MPRTCQLMGVSRDTFYSYRSTKEEGAVTLASYCLGNVLSYLAFHSFPGIHWL